MINDAEFENELSSDDSDYRPDREVDTPSENSEPDGDDLEEVEENSKTKSKKKLKKPSIARKSKLSTETEKTENEELKKEVDIEEEKRIADALWADFLGDTGSKTDTKESGEKEKKMASSSSLHVKPAIPNKKPTPPIESNKIFEFAGEIVEIKSKNNESDKEISPSTTKTLTPGNKRPAGGLGSVLSQLTKKNKLNMLEKTKLDWDVFKQNEGINEELQSHNRGRDGLVNHLMMVYTSNFSDWKKYAKFDRYRYTRNLVDAGNDRFNLMILCWNEGQSSAIHDHADSHCFMKILKGGLTEVKYSWPQETSETTILNDFKSNCGEIGAYQDENGEYVQELQEIGRSTMNTNDVCYINDNIGLHRVENSSNTDVAVSLHLYCPPFDSCNVFNKAGKKTPAKVTFWSKFGKRAKEIEEK
ncbi:CLUMA_CG009315, isoform A [Clunio marinus]|uniref:cysteine dioxygenase n=1 Tax=Clunio marinus TaxID=568069 RepID=A0A1J1I8G8_9DIPT|nr:CLUMA_CG009315, isoform A [Clunio marinus]